MERAPEQSNAEVKKIKKTRSSDLILWVLALQSHAFESLVADSCESIVAILAVDKLIHSLNFGGRSESDRGHWFPQSWDQLRRKIEVDTGTADY